MPSYTSDSYNEMTKMFLSYAHDKDFRDLFVNELVDKIEHDNIVDKNKEYVDTKIFSRKIREVVDTAFEKASDSLDSFINFLTNNLARNEIPLDVIEYKNTIPSPQLTPQVVRGKKAEELEKEFQERQDYAKKLVQDVMPNFKMRPLPY